jgi:hypothetical protein
VDISASLAIRAAIAAKLKADLDAAAALLAKAAADIKARVKVEIIDANKGCDAKCIEKKVVDKSKDFCKSVDKIVKKVGEGMLTTHSYTKMVSIY